MTTEKSMGHERQVNDRNVSLVLQISQPCSPTVMKEPMLNELFMLVKLDSE